MNCERACELLERLRVVLADVLVAGELVFLPESSPVLPESSPSACCGGRPVAASIRASSRADRTRCGRPAEPLGMQPCWASGRPRKKICGGEAGTYVMLRIAIRML